MTEVQGGYTNGVVACKVVNAHEIMGDRAPEGPVHFRLLGMYGILPADAIPLIQCDGFVGDDSTRATSAGRRDEVCVLSVCTSVTWRRGRRWDWGMGLIRRGIGSSRRSSLLRECVFSGGASTESVRFGLDLDVLKFRRGGRSLSRQAETSGLRVSLWASRCEGKSGIGCNLLSRGRSATTQRCRGRICCCADRVFFQLMIRARVRRGDGGV